MGCSLPVVGKGVPAVAEEWMSLPGCSPGGWDMWACWEPHRVFCSPTAPTFAACPVKPGSNHS